MFVSRWQWNKLKSLMTAPEAERVWRWQEERYEVLHIARVWKILTDEGPTSESLAHAGYGNEMEERVEQIKRWRCHTLDRVLNRFRMGCFSSEDSRVEEFWQEHRETQYVKDVTEFDWKSWTSEPRDGVTFSPSEFDSGLSAEHLMRGLVVNDQVWIWETPENPMPNATPAWSIRPIAHDVFYRGKAQSAKFSPVPPRSTPKSRLSGSACCTETQTPPRVRRAQNPTFSSVPTSVADSGWSGTVNTTANGSKPTISTQIAGSGQLGTNSKPIFGPPRPLDPVASQSPVQIKSPGLSQSVSKALETKSEQLSPSVNFVVPPQPQQTVTTQPITISAPSALENHDGVLQLPLGTASSDLVPAMSRKEKLLARRRYRSTRRATESHAYDARSAKRSGAIESVGVPSISRSVSDSRKMDINHASKKGDQKPTLRVSPAPVTVSASHPSANLIRAFDASLSSFSEEPVHTRSLIATPSYENSNLIPLAASHSTTGSDLNGAAEPPVAGSVSVPAAISNPTTATTVAVASSNIPSAKIKVHPTDTNAFITPTSTAAHATTSIIHVATMRGLKRAGSPLETLASSRAEAKTKTRVHFHPSYHCSPPDLRSDDSGSSFPPSTLEPRQTLTLAAAPIPTTAATCTSTSVAGVNPINVKHVGKPRPLSSLTEDELWTMLLYGDRNSDAVNKSRTVMVADACASGEKAVIQRGMDIDGRGRKDGDSYTDEMRDVNMGGKADSSVNDVKSESRGLWTYSLAHLLG
ncbi:hypothetical protein BDP27DRAFT_1429312 [Rhodocollybia butyracea]|uniref:Uncharacterized protein n=1 Tax=Rhodocollybia butyracea TaxID=206335 RepID=A0A9P5U065_9AGAR|nr:hypothetical protein BDP27DRAFT_1429312 [Rhodocollybia butyracea]